MKKHILVFCFMIFGLQVTYSQDAPPDNNTPVCDCCVEDYINPATQLPYPGKEAEFVQCVNDCSNGINSCAVPIDSSILLLFLSGGILGIYYVYANNKEKLK